MTRCWVLRLMADLRKCIEGGYVTIGWENARKLNTFSTWEEFKKHLRDSYPDLYQSPYALGNAAGSAWRFIHDMEPGDLIILPTPGQFKIAEVVGNAYYAEEAYGTDTAWRRPVEWVHGDFSRREGPASLQSRLRAQQTCVEATDLNDVVVSIRGGIRRGVAFKKVRDRICDDIAALLAEIHHDEFEDTVVDLLTSAGLRAERLPTNTGMPGDLDIIAILPTGVPGIPLRIGFQVKKHHGTTDHYAVEQALERMKAACEKGMSEKIDRVFVITTAKEYTDEARQYAEENSIHLLSADDIVEWIADRGLSAAFGRFGYERDAGAGK